jgi:hypothetical protein
MEKLAPVIILLQCVVEAGLQAKKKAKFSCNRPQEELARPLGVKRPLGATITTRISPPHQTTAKGGIDLEAPECKRDSILE